MVGSAIILAGGRSSRMGMSKALLPFDGEPLIAHLVNRIAPLFSELIVVGAPGQDLPTTQARIVRDDVAYQGPLAGIAYGLRSLVGPSAFVTSTDAGFLKQELVAHLISRLGGNEAVVPRWEGRLQPLVAVYSRRVLGSIEAQLAEGDLTLLHLFDRLKPVYVDDSEIRRFDPDGESFISINTPLEYERAVARWRDRA